MSSNLEQTKGKFKVEGKVVGIKNDNASHEGFTKSDKPFKTLAFFVQTSKVNKVKVELFGMERDQVVAYSQKAKESKKISWVNRFDNHDDFKVMGVNMFLEKGSDGKNVKKVLVELDAIDYLQANLKDGDSVRVSGSSGIDFQEFENQEGKMSQSKKFNFNSITKLDEEIDFEAEGFKEVSQFEQEIVATDVMIDDETKKLIISAKVIKYGGDAVNTSFVVDNNERPKLLANMSKRLGFGDFIKVYGKIVNSSITEEAPEEDTPVEADEWGEEDDIKDDFETSYITNYISELQVTSVDSTSYEQKKYNDEDFFSEDEQNFNGDVKDEFGDDEGFGDDEDMNDLPFA